MRNRYKSQYEQITEEKGLIKGIAVILIVTGIIILIIFASHRANVLFFHGVTEKDGMASTGQFGDLIGGFVGTLFNLAGAILLFYTLREQRDNFNRERLEGKFFEMVQIHRDNVNEMELPISKEEIHKGRKVIHTICMQFQELFEETNFLFAEKDEKDIYIEEYLSALKSNRVILDREINLKDYAQLDILYLIVFFGLSKNGYETLNVFLSEHYQPSFYVPILNLARLKPIKASKYFKLWREFHRSFDEEFKIRAAEQRKADWQDNIEYPTEIEGWTSIEESNYLKTYYKDNFFKYYGGHQFRLGHYFRHLFQAITFIDKQKLLSYKDKYEHIKFLRGQLSTYEQMLYFLNSLSTLGRVAEFEKRRLPEKSKNPKRHFITKYNLIKNIPIDEIVPGIRIISFYPDISYEAIPNPGVKARREKLLETYWEDSY